MPKKATAIATTALVTAPQNLGVSLVSLNSELGTADILAIVTSKAETQFNEELVQARKVLRDAETHYGQLVGDRKKLYRDECRKAGDDLAKKLKPVIESLGGTVKLVDKQHNQYQNCDLTDGKFTQTIQIVSPETKDSYYTTKFTAKVDPSEKFLALGNEITEAQKAVAEAQSKALVCRQKLAGLPMLERQTRARLATAKLESSADGQALLAMLTSDLETAMAALPVIG